MVERRVRFAKEIIHILGGVKVLESFDQGTDMLFVSGNTLHFQRVKGDKMEMGRPGKRLL